MVTLLAVVTALVTFGPSMSRMYNTIVSARMASCQYQPRHMVHGVDRQLYTVTYLGRRCSLPPTRHNHHTTISRAMDMAGDVTFPASLLAR
jgi:hypothetical protein